MCALGPEGGQAVVICNGVAIGCDACFHSGMEQGFQEKEEGGDCQPPCVPVAGAGLQGQPYIATLQKRSAQTPEVFR